MNAQKSAAVRAASADSHLDDETTSDPMIGPGRFSALGSGLRQSTLMEAMSLSLDDLIARTEMLVSCSRAGSPV